MYYYLLRVVLKDGSEVELWTKSTNAMKSITEIIEDSYTELDDVDGVLYYKREKVA